MQEANNKTGRLRVGGKTMTAQLNKADKNKTKKTNSAQATDSYINTAQAPAGEEELSSPTEVLRQDTFSGSEYIPGSEPTTQLSVADLERKESITLPEFEKPADVSFTVTKKVIIIHTDEVI